MNRFIWWQAFWAHPTTILTITRHTATLASIHTPQTPYASLTPDPTLLSHNGTLSAGFRLRNFIDVSLPLSDKKPFSLFVVLPSESPQTHHLAVEVGTLLTQLNLPPYCITTTPMTATQTISSFPDILKPSSRPSITLFRTMICATTVLMLGTLISSMAVTTHNKPLLPIATTTPLPQKKPTSLRQPPFPLYTLLATAMALHRWNHQLLKLEGTQTHHTHTSIVTNPAYAERMQMLLSHATQSTWTLKKPQYRPGLPPLYKVIQVIN